MVQKYAITVHNLVKRYKKAEVNAVDNISFNVERGEFFSLLGPNGAGKTTTISILTTTLSKTKGKINIAGYDLDREQNQVRRSIGIIFQNPSVDLNLSAEENVRFHAVLYGLYPFSPVYSLMPKEYKDKVTNLAEVLGLENDLFKPIKTFSGGMKRKLEIMRSLIHDPQILFLDEPTSGLDPLSRKNLWNYLTDVRKKKKMTVFLTTHYLEEADDADNVCIINSGKIVSQGTPRQIKHDLIKNYLTVEAKNMNELKSELRKKKITFQDGRPIRIDVQKSSPQQIIQAIQTPLTHLDIHSPTLEEAYLEIIGGESA